MRQSKVARTCQASRTARKARRATGAWERTPQTLLVGDRRRLRMGLAAIALLGILLAPGTFPTGTALAVWAQERVAEPEPERDPASPAVGAAASTGVGANDQTSDSPRGFWETWDVEAIRAWAVADGWRLVALFLAIFLAFAAGKIVRAVFLSTSRRLRGKGRFIRASVFSALAHSVVFLAVGIGIRIGLLWLRMPDGVQAAAQTTMRVWFAVAIAWACYNLVEVVEQFLMRMASRTTSRLDDMLVPLVRASLRVTVVVLAIVQVATIVSQKPVTSILAGLGVGGLAIGLAAQDTIKNFFGSIMIFSDRPFEMGDRIQVGGFDGTVEVVGFRSTRIRTLDGHVVTIPNATVANEAIRNVTKRPHIKRAFQIGVTYDTSPEQLDRAIAIVEEILHDHEGMDPDYPPRIFFTEFGDSALILSVIYWYHPADWWAYCAFNQRVNREILRRFNEAGIEFAFPTQTIYVASDRDEGDS